MAGKAASRLNAFQHGQAGAGDLLAPGEDLAKVAHRASRFARELGAEDEVGRTLAHRAALLSLRMERASERDLTAVAANVAAARAEFDRELAEERDRLVDDLETGVDPRAVIAGLEELPAGVAYLIDSWGALRDRIAKGDQAAIAVARAWFGEGEAAGTAAELAARIDAERDRLTAESIPLHRALEATRHEVGVLARFDPSPEATLARRYEAAAERGMYRALREIALHRRQREGHLGPNPTHPVVPPPTGPPAPPLTPAPATEPRPQPAPPPTPLGSFRAEAPVAPPLTSRPLILADEPPLFPIGTRKKRPDLARLDRPRR